jgi:hypothetical protein
MKSLELLLLENRLGNVRPADGHFSDSTDCGWDVSRLQGNLCRFGQKVKHLLLTPGFIISLILTSPKAFIYAIVRQRPH